MSFKSLWRTRARGSFKAPEDRRSKAQRDFDLVFDTLMMASRVRGDHHAYVHFCDNTHYRICQRYVGMLEQAASVELAKCAALVVPTDDAIDLVNDDDCEPADKMCMQCCRILHDALYELEDRLAMDPRIIWADVHTGAIAKAKGHNNLGGLPDVD